MKNVAHILSELESELEFRKEKGLFRQTAVTCTLTDFSSNDYLGFARKPFQVPAMPMPSGSGGSRLLTVSTDEARQTEEHIATFHGCEAALLYGSGYQANTGLLSAIGKRHTLFLYDEHIHASMIDGMRLSFADRYKFKHNNTDDLRRKLSERKHRHVFVLTESVFSMDGDLAPLHAIAALCAEYDAGLIVDEAHALGVFGDRGEGLAHENIVGFPVFARIYTYGKAMGVHGAAVCGSRILRDYLVNFSRPFIYSTAPPPLFYRHIHEAYRQFPNAQERMRLQELIAYYRSLVQAARSDCRKLSDNPSAIQYLLCGNREKAIELSRHLKDNGFNVKAILSPTVPAGTERLRVCLHSYNTRSELDNMLSILKRFC